MTTATQILDSIVTKADMVTAARLKSRAKVVEKINNDYILSSFDYDALIEGDAAAQVWLELKGDIEGGRSQEEETDETILRYVQRLVSRRAMNFRSPSSSSASSNQADLAQHAEWISAFQLIHNSQL